MKPLDATVKKRGRKPKAKKIEGKFDAKSVNRKHTTPLKAKDIKKQLEDVALSAGRHLVHQTSASLVNAVQSSIKPNGKFSDDICHLLDASLSSHTGASPGVAVKNKHVGLGRGIRSSPRRPKPIKYFEREVEKQLGKDMRNGGHSAICDKNGELDDLKAKKKQKISVKVQKIKSTVNLVTGNGHSRLIDDDADFPLKTSECQNNGSSLQSLNSAINVDDVEMGVDAIDFQKMESSEQPHIAESGNIIKQTFSKIVRSASKTSIGSNGDNVKKEYSLCVQSKTGLPPTETCNRQYTCVIS